MSPTQNLNHVSVSTAQMLLELWQGWYCKHSPRKPVNHPLIGEHFPNIQADPTPTQFNDVPWGPVAVTRKKELCLPLHSPREEALGYHEASTQTSLLWDEQIKWLQMLLMSFSPEPASYLLPSSGQSVIVLHPSYISVLYVLHCSPVLVVRLH